MAQERIPIEHLYDALRVVKIYLGARDTFPPPQVAEEAIRRIQGVMDEVIMLRKRVDILQDYYDTMSKVSDEVRRIEYVAAKMMRQES